MITSPASLDRTRYDAGEEVSAVSTILDLDLFTPRHAIKKGEPAWDIALLFPTQGNWSEEDYLALDTNWLVELVDGFIEVLPMPTMFHQLVVQFLYEKLKAFVVTHVPGFALMAPLPLRLWPEHLREPDVIYLRPERVKDRHQPPDGADLVMEVVSPGAENRKRDLVKKRRAYAKARIPEYWIVDPEEQRITVLTLKGKSYRVHGRFGPGTEATSVLLRGFAVDVAAALAAGEAPTQA
jgi:Uma2 family endonuclease